jgi:hypothetical protein
VLTVIFKGLDQFIAEDKFEKAGRIAEEQLAFYLRRAFVEDKDILVFNNLRFENNHDVAQIDHLILHKYGMIIIESKSVTSKVEINEREEWIRWFDNIPKGMPSPIQQAKRQGEFLRRYLCEHDEVLMGKIMGRQSGFRFMPLDILVAISDTGIVQRPKSVSLEEVCKADQVVDQVKTIFQRWRKANGFLTFDLKKGGYEFYQSEIDNITKFLLAKNKPLAYQASLQAIPTTKAVRSWNSNKDGSEISKNKTSSSYNQPSVVKRQLEKHIEVNPVHVCAYCKSVNLCIEYGYSYYFKCLDCEKNTTIKSTCENCGAKAKTRKSGLQFYAECAPCQTSKLLYTNPSPR